jgi:hypothetical protein
VSCYEEKLKDPRWQKKRLLILQAANWRCEDCGRHDRTLEVHHTVYISKFEPWDYDITTLMCLCWECHEIRQQRENAFRVALGKITRFLPMASLENEVWRILQDVSRRETERLNGEEPEE